MPIDYRHAFLMTFEMVFRYVVNIQFIASLANIRALSHPAALILIPLHIVSLVPRHHLHVPSSIDFPPSSTALKILINQWNSNRAVLVLSKSLQFGTYRYTWFFFVYCQSLMISIQTLYVGRRQESATDKAKRIKNPTWWNRCILFICCVSIPQDAHDGQNTGGHR